MLLHGVTDAEHFRSITASHGAILQTGIFALPLREFAYLLRSGSIENKPNIIAGFLNFPRGLQRVAHAPSAFRAARLRKNDNGYFLH